MSLYYITTSVAFKLSLFDILHKPIQSININTFDTIVFTFTIIALLI